jgi:hypothetical protein
MLASKHHPEPALDIMAERPQILGRPGHAQPGVARPGLPQQRQQQQPSGDAVEAVLVGHVGADLRGGEDVDQVEEQLERSRPVLVVRGASAAQNMDAAPFLVVAPPG